MTHNPWPTDYPVADDTPEDAYGPEYWRKQIRDGFEGLIHSLDSYDKASQQVAEIDLRLRPMRYRHVG